MKLENSSSVFWREGLLTRVGVIYLSIFVATTLLSVIMMRFTALFWFGLILGLSQMVSLLLKNQGARYVLRLPTR